jgi:hydroxymethylglutaryl-CoA reductase
MSIAERVAEVRERTGLTDEEERLLLSFCGLPDETADMMIENVVGVHPLPLGIATNFIVNGREVLVPMAVEETSVVAAASNAAKLARPQGFSATASDPIMIGQIQVLDPDPEAGHAIDEHRDEILALANEQDRILVKFGGGAREVAYRRLAEDMGVVHLLVDVRDAMGANAVNTMAEAVAPLVERVTGGTVLLRILSNLAVNRTVRTEVTYAREVVGGNVVDGVVAACRFAALDPFRAATHNKGIMNGIDAVVIATGNDWRAIETGAHAFAARNGGYAPLATWERDGDGNLRGILTLPLAVGIIGGATKVHPMARLALKILGVRTAADLAETVAAVGLAQNFAALRALATRGIQAGHMKLHARNIAHIAGAEGDEIDRIARQMVTEENVRTDRARELLDDLRKNKKV